MLDQVEEGLFAPLDVVEHDHQRQLAAACSSVLRNAQAISSADVAASVSPSSEPIAAAAAPSDGGKVELLEDLDHRASM